MPNPDPRPLSHRARVLALIAAVLIGGLLTFTAYAKAFHPSPKPTLIEWFNAEVSGFTFDRTLAGIEIAIAFLLLGLHRQWSVWLLNAIFFGGLAGYAFYKSWHGEACGCFAKLWDPPPYTTVALDIVILVVSLVIARTLHAPRSLRRITLAGALIAGVAGGAFSEATTPPKRDDTAQQHGNRLAHTRLLESEPMRDIREQAPGGPAWLVCAFDPTCHICEEMKPIIEFRRDGLAETADPILQVRVFEIPELHASLGIEPWTWETPTIFVVQDAHITRLWSGKTLEGFTDERFQEIYDTLEAGGYPPEDAPPLYAEPKK